VSVDFERQRVARRAAEAFIDSHTVAFAIISKDLRFADASDAFVDLFSPITKDVKDLLLTDILYEFVGAEEDLRKILSGEESLYRLELVSRPIANSSSPPYFAFTIQPLWQSQPADGLLLLMEDITPVAELQQQLVQERNELRLVRRKLDQANKELVQLNEMKSLFLSMAAHDLRAPLTAMYGYSDLLLEMEDVSADIQKKALNTIREQAERMHRMIDDLLSLNQIEKDQVIVTPSAFALNEGVDEVIRSLGLIIASEGLTLEVKLPDPSLMLWVDPGKLMQILFNLLHNAAKYTPTGERILVEAYSQDTEAVLKIHNDGASLTEGQLARIFTLFYRADGARSEKRSGNGLGLYIVKMLVEAQQGTVEVQSEPGVGTTFIIRLPLALD
jgi:signal transduction histidine kinase